MRLVKTVFEKSFLTKVSEKNLKLNFKLENVDKNVDLTNASSQNNYNPIINFEGIQYFDSLKVLDARGFGIQLIPSFPKIS